MQAAAEQVWGRALQGGAQTFLGVRARYFLSTALPRGDISGHWMQMGARTLYGTPWTAVTAW